MILKGQTTTDTIIWEIAIILIVGATIGILYFFLSNTGNSLPVIQINSQYNNVTKIETLQLLMPREIANPSNITLYINNITTKIPLKTAKYYYFVKNNTYVYNYNFSTVLVPSAEKLFSNQSSKIVLISYNDSVNKTIYSAPLNYQLTSAKALSYSSGQYIQFSINPATTSWEIVLKNNSYSINGQIIQNGERLYLPNGNYYIDAKQINSSSTLYFDGWQTLPFYGELTVSPNDTESATLTVGSTSGIVSLHLGYSGLVTLSSNKVSQINNETNFACGENQTRFCIDNSVRNLNFTYYENKTSFSFNYPQLLSGNATERLAFEDFNTSFVNKATGEASCQSGFNQFSNSQTVSNVGPTSCILYAQYVKEYRIVANTTNSSEGSVSIYTSYNGKTTTGNEVIVWVPIGTSAQITANPKTYYQFSNWTEIPGNQILTTNPYSFTVSGPANYTAHFKFNPPTISWTATSNLGSVTASFSANAIPSNSLKGWSNITSGTTPYTFTFNKSNVFSSNAINTSFVFSGSFASTISAQDGSQESGTFSGLTIYCNSASVSTSTTESYSYNWKSSNDCQNVTIEANYYLQPPPPPPPPPPPGGGTGSGGGGFFNANMTQFLFQEIYPIGVAMNLTTSNMNIANFTVYSKTGSTTSVWYNPLLSGSKDNFSFEQIDVHKAYSCTQFDSTCITSNGEIFRYIEDTNTTTVYLVFPKNFSYSGYNYSFDSQELSLNYLFTFKNGTTISSSTVSGSGTPFKQINAGKDMLVALNTSFASYVFHYDTPSAKGTNASYVSSYTLSMTFGYAKQIPHEGEIKLISYPDAVSNLNINIPSTISYQEQKSQQSYGNVNATNYLITSQKVEAYSVTVSSTLHPPDFNGEYLLYVYDNTTKTTLVYSNETADTSIPITGLLTNQTYKIYGIYYVPVTIDTNFVGQPFAFGNENMESPFYVNNFIDNNYYEFYSLGLYTPSTTEPYYYFGYQNETFFASPAPLSRIGYVPTYTAPTIIDGYWDGNNFNSIPPPAILNNGGTTNCTDTGQIASCITFEGSSGGSYDAGPSYYGFSSSTERLLTFYGPILPTVIIQYRQPTFSGNLNFSSCVGPCNVTFVQGALGEERESSGQFTYINPIYYSALDSQISNINAPLTINLNYGYYIPIYIGANAYYGDYPGSAYYNESFTSLPEALNASTNTNLAGELLSPTGKPHPILDLYYLFNVKNASSTVDFSNYPVFYTEKEVNYYGNQTPHYYLLNNSPNSGFTTRSPIIDEHGSSNERHVYGSYNIYGSFSSYWRSNYNGYIFYEKDSG